MLALYLFHTFGFSLNTISSLNTCTCICVRVCVYKHSQLSTKSALLKLPFYSLAWFVKAVFIGVVVWKMLIFSIRLEGSEDKNFILFIISSQHPTQSLAHTRGLTMLNVNYQVALNEGLSSSGILKVYSPPPISPSWNIFHINLKVNLLVKHMPLSNLYSIVTFFRDKSCIFLISIWFNLCYFSLTNIL